MKFPLRYLELYDEKVRELECERMAKQSSPIESLDQCKRRLDALSNSYFNSKGVPEATEIGVALEGGGNKSAPFALGVLAGLAEGGFFDSRRVTAVASASGGTYAASFLFNRIYDSLKAKNSPSPGADDYSAWFRSCIPDEYIFEKKYFGPGGSADLSEVACGELTRGPDTKYPFKDQYKYQGHVWTHHDLLVGRNQPALNTSNSMQVQESASLAALIAETAVTIPVQFLFRTVLRWPLNSAPSKAAYVEGLQRQYGYSADAWNELMEKPEADRSKEIAAFRSERTLNELWTRLSYPQYAGPTWIIATTAPGSLSGIEWLNAHPRDPVRHQFEITREGIGSGIYGYRLGPKTHDDYSIFVAEGRQPDMPIVNAVATSGAFFDDDQMLVTRQPERLIFNAFQHFANITWFSEIPNYNVKQSDRNLQMVTPYPLYLGWTGKGDQSPFIHLQDGGNSENTGILPLLRRGYKSIVYSHGTSDAKADFQAICHLKNHLELDGTYAMDSDDLDRMWLGVKGALAKQSGFQFQSYLDQLCTSQLDDSDAAAFPMEESNTSSPDALSKLICRRLVDSTTRAHPDLITCREYAANVIRLGKQCEKVENAGSCPPATFSKADELMFSWPVENGGSSDSSTSNVSSTLTFRVSRAVDDQGNPLGEKRLLSTVYAVIPAIPDWTKVKEQLVLSKDANGNDITSWEHLLTKYDGPISISYCRGPGGVSYGIAGAGKHIPSGSIPCNALAYILHSKSVSHHHPSFPQDNFVLETLRSSYTQYGAYYDLGRQRVRELVMRPQ